MKMRFLKFFLFSAIAVLSAKAVYAGACVVATEKSDYSKTNTLPYLIEKTTYNRESGGCFINNDYADKATANQYVAFQTAETEPADTSDIVRTIVLTAMSSESTDRGKSATLYFKTLDPMVVGNPSDAAINGTNEATYDTDSELYIWEDDVIKDYGFIVIDGRTNFANKSDSTEWTDNLPLKCVDGSSDVFLRNMIIVTNGYSKTELLDDSATQTSCFKDGGNLHVCSGTYTEGSDPNTDSDWCDEDSTSGSTFPGIEINPGIGLFNCDDEDKITWYDDDDGDGFGDASDSKEVCPDLTPSGYVQDDSDCDDTNADINPDAEEICDEVDNNCDALIDDEELGDGVCTATESEVCTDGLDNDGDTLIDCADEEDCASDTTCFSPEVTEICDDGIDNDTDGYMDCDDDECDTAYACNGVGPEEECSDGIDNDEDTATDCDDDDCTQDAYCTGVTTETLCSDGLDDDGDTLVDCDDTDCANDAACAVTATETACDDDLDDDSDGAIDCDDSDCVFATECVNASESDCTDGLDDDGDGLTDCDDDDCAEVVVEDDLTCTDLAINEVEGADAIEGGGCGCNLTAQKAPALQNLLLALLGLIPLMAAMVLRRRGHES